jgi:hypothetical protein
MHGIGQRRRGEPPGRPAAPGKAEIACACLCRYIRRVTAASALLVATLTSLALLAGLLLRLARAD